MEETGIELEYEIYTKGDKTEEAESVGIGIKKTVERIEGTQRNVHLPQKLF